MIDRSRWLRRLVTIASWVLVAALGIEAIMALMSDDVMRDLAYLLPSVDNPTPKSAATRRRDNPLVSEIRTASCLKSSVCFLILLVHLCECYTLK